MGGRARVDICRDGKNKDRYTTREETAISEGSRVVEYDGGISELLYCWRYITFFF